MFFEQKTPFLALFEENFSGKRGLRIWGVPPPPFTDKIRKVVFEGLPKNVFNNYYEGKQGLQKNPELNVLTDNFILDYTA